MLVVFLSVVEPSPGVQITLKSVIPSRILLSFYSRFFVSLKLVFCLWFRNCCCMYGILPANERCQPHSVWIRGTSQSLGG